MRQPFQILAAQQFQPGGEPPTEIELLQVGDWQTPWKGHIVNTLDDFKQMIANFQSGAGKFQPDNKLPINLDHQGGGAAGWIHGLEIRGNSLWGTGIEWTPLGIEKLAGKEYAYLSSEWSPVWGNPLDEEELVDNVFEGAALTNYPLYPSLQPLVASHKQKKDLTADQKGITLYMKGSAMKLEDLLAKEPADLTDEEKAFVVEHKDELSEEQATALTEAGVLEAESAEEESEEEAEEEEAEEESEESEEEESKEASKTKTISASKLKKLEADAARGVEAANKLQAMEASNETEAMLITASKDGRFLQASHVPLTKFFLTLNASQQKQFKALVASLPKLPLGKAKGKSEEGSANSAAETLIAQAEKLVADKKVDSFQEAMKQVTASNKELVEQAEEDN
jgi:hypothetical protein